MIGKRQVIEINDTKTLPSYIKHIRSLFKNIKQLTLMHYEYHSMINKETIPARQGKTMHNMLALVTQKNANRSK